MGNPENRSFVTVDGLCFVASKSSDRNRDRMHILPADSQMSLESFAVFTRLLVNNPHPKRIFLRNEDHYEVVDPSELVDMRFLDKRERREAIYSLASSMFVSEEVIIEDVIPDEITIQNLPQVVFEPVPINLDF